MHRAPTLTLTLALAVTLPWAGGCAVEGGTGRSAGTGGSVGEAGGGAGASASVSASCTLDEIERGYLRLPNGDFVYVEPQHFGRHGDGWVLAGQPAYRARVDERGRGGIVARGGLIGVTFAGGEARAIPMPPHEADARVVWVRGAPSPRPERLRFLYELAADSASRILFAEHDPTTGAWEILDEVPAPPMGRLRGLDAAAGPLDVPLDGGSRSEASQPGMPNGPDRPVLAVPLERPHGGVDVLLYFRDAFGWEPRMVWERWVDEIALGTGGDSGLVLAIAGLDPEFDTQRASIRTLGLRARGAGFDRARVLRHQSGSPGERFAMPVFARSGARLDLGWLQRSPDGPTSAWVRPDVEGDPDVAIGGPHLIDPSAASIIAVDGMGGETLWLTRHVFDAALGALPQIVLSRVDPHGVTRVGSVPDPFHGPFAAQRAAPNELLLVGPEARFDLTSPHVRSLVIRLSIRCPF